MGRLVASIALVLVVLLAACSSAAPAATATIGPYQQTWTKPYGETSCAEWFDAMNDHERFVAAGDMLYRGWQSAGTDRIPPDATIRLMEAAISDSCQGAGEELGVNIAEVAAILYIGADDLKP